MAEIDHGETFDENFRTGRSLVFPVDGIGYRDGVREIVTVDSASREQGRISENGVVDYIPPEEDVISGEDLKGFVAPKTGN